MDETSSVQVIDVLNLLESFVNEQTASLTMLSDRGFFDRKVVEVLMSKIMAKFSFYFLEENLRAEYELCVLHKGRFDEAFKRKCQTLDKSRHFCMHLQEIVSYNFFSLF